MLSKFMMTKFVVLKVSSQFVAAPINNIFAEKPRAIKVSF